jgi:hypothetical protein
MVSFVLTISDSLEGHFARATLDQQKADGLFSREGDLRFEEALAAFEDNAYFLEDHLKATLEMGYETVRKFAIPNSLTPWISVRLVRIDADTYSKKFNIPVEQIVVKSDTTWLYSTAYHADWSKLNFEAEGWRQTIRRPDSNPSEKSKESLRVFAVSSRSRDEDVFIRKEIDVPGYPVSGRVYYRMNGPSQFYVNGVQIPSPAEDKPVALTSYLKEGKNLLALACPIDKLVSIEGAAVIMYIPNSIFN